MRTRKITDDTINYADRYLSQTKASGGKLLSLALGIVILVLSYHCWYEVRPSQIGFDVTGKGSAVLRIALNNKDETEIVDLQSSEQKRIDIVFKNIKFPKKIKISAENVAPETELHIKNLVFKKGDSEPFPINIENKTDVNPAKAPLSINDADVGTAIKIDWKAFFIIAVLAYLFVYKTLLYVKSVSVYDPSKIDTVFVVVFFVCLFVPMSHIDKSDKSPIENRYLAEYKPLIDDDHKINLSFGIDFEKYFQDRFALRKYMIVLYNTMHMALNDKNDRAIYDKKTGFLYLYDGDVLVPSIDELDKSFNALRKFDDWCKKHGIKLYTLIVPDKNMVYRIDKIPNHPTKKKHDEFMDYVAETAKDISVVYPYREMIAGGKENFMFFQTEHHWTDDGAFIGYKALMKEIQKDYPDLHILTADDFDYSYNNLVRSDSSRNYHYGQTLHIASIINKAKYHKTKYRYYTHKEYGLLNQYNINKFMQKEKTFFYSNGDDRKVLLLGTSQSENLTEFVPFTFKNVKRIRNNQVIGIKDGDEFKIMKYYENKILEYKPDILIFCITFGNITKLHKLFDKN